MTRPEICFGSMSELGPVTMFLVRIKIGRPDCRRFRQVLQGRREELLLRLHGRRSPTKVAGQRDLHAAPARRVLRRVCSPSCQRSHRFHHRLAHFACGWCGKLIGRCVRHDDRAPVKQVLHTLRSGAGAAQSCVAAVAIGDPVEFGAVRHVPLRAGASGFARDAACCAAGACDRCRRRCTYRVGE